MNTKPPVNREIRAREVRLIDETEKQVGVVPLEQALQTAKERGLDLIQVTEKADPPVCKIMDYGKYLYREKKKAKGTKTHQGELKGIRLRFNISQHDLEIRAKQAEKFLKAGDKVRIEMRLRGREKALREFSEQKAKQFLEILGQLIPYKLERGIKKDPRGFSMIISKE